ncbi:potassium channel family protein [Chloroflexota bacterium]
MYIVVAGGGQIGYYLAKILLNLGHEVLVMEKDASRCKEIVEELGSVVTHGDSCEAATLEEAGTERADMLIAVTGDDEDNLVSCQVAKHIFNVPRTIARIKNPRNESLFKTLGVDVTVSSTNIILAHIEQELPSHPLIPLLKLKGGNLVVVEVKIPPGSNVVGKRLGDLQLADDIVVVPLLVVSNGKEPRMPKRDTVFNAEDEVVMLTNTENEDTLRNAFTDIL